MKNYFDYSPVFVNKTSTIKKLLSRAASAQNVQQQREAISMLT